MHDVLCKFQSWSSTHSVSTFNVWIFVYHLKFQKYRERKSFLRQEKEEKRKTLFAFYFELKTTSLSRKR